MKEMGYGKALHWMARRFGLEVRRAPSDNWLGKFAVSTVIDVGANTGQFASLARRLFPSAEIHAFEPLPDCLSRLTNVFSADKRFRAYGHALGDRDGTTTFNRSDFSPSSSVLYMDDTHRRLFPQSAHSEVVTVEIRRLDDVLIDEGLESEILLKLDVQGYEDRVLDGAPHILSRTRIVQTEVLFEPLYRGQAQFADVYDRLSQYGFLFHGHLEQIASRDDGRILWADALFLKPPVQLRAV